jgi:hypothetical protein
MGDVGWRWGAGLLLAFGALGTPCSAAGDVPPRPAAETATLGLEAVAPAPDTLLTIGRLQYGGGGDWYANPSSLPNLLRTIRERTGLPVAGEPRTVTPLDPRLRDLPYLYMTGHGDVRFSSEERQALRRYLEDGGFLHADDNYGLDTSFRREMGAIFPDRELVQLPPDHPVFGVLYDFPEGLPKIHEHDGEPPRALGIFHRERLVVLYTQESDLGDGWEDPGVHDNPPEVREAALRMGVNLFLHVLGQGG